MRVYDHSDLHPEVYYVKGDTVKILNGPRKGQIGKVDWVVDNGVFIEMPDGKFHTLTFKNMEKVNEDKS